MAQEWSGQTPGLATWEGRQYAAWMANDLLGGGTAETGEFIPATGGGDLLRQKYRPFSPYLVDWRVPPVVATISVMGS